MTTDRAPRPRLAPLMRAMALGLAALVTLSGTAMAQSDEPVDGTAVPEEPVSNRISVRIADAFGNDPEAIFR